MLQSLMAIIGLLALVTSSVPAEEARKTGEALKMGEKLPEISAISETGELISLSSYKGKSGVVLFFFPKADTPGCTTESCGFRDQVAQYAEKGFVVLGASRDAPAGLKAFKEKYKLNFSLISDPEGKLASALGVTPGARQTVVIGKDGSLEMVIKTVEARTHPAKLIQELNAAK
jgi:peroxiredoxin Q/BCP